MTSSARKEQERASTEATDAPPPLRPARAGRRPRRWRRWLFVLFVLFVLAVIGARWFALPRIVESQLRGRIERLFAGTVTIGALDIDLIAGRLEVIDLHYRDPSDRTVFVVRSARARFSMHDLWAGEAMPRIVFLEGVELNLALNPSGSNVEENFKKPTGDGAPRKMKRLPQMVFQNCRVNLDAPLVFREKLRLMMNGEISPSGLNPLRSQVEIEVQARYGPEKENRALKPVKLIGSFNATTAGFKLSTDSQGVALHPAIREILAETLVETGWDWLNPVGNVRVEFAGEFHRQHGLPNYHLSLYNAEGLGIRIRDFPYAIDDIQGVSLILPGTADRRGQLRLLSLKGNHGPAIASISGEVFGFLADPPEPWVHLLLEGRDVPLDGALKNAIEKVDPEFAGVWEAVTPAGSVDFQCLLFKSDRSSRVRAAINAKVQNGEFNYIGFPGGAGDRTGFPYPLTNVNGEFETQLGFQRFEVRGQGSGRSDIHVLGHIRTAEQAMGKPLIDVLITGKDVPFDDTLRQAMLDTLGDRLWKQLQPSGRSDIRVHLKQWEPKADFEVEVTLDLGGQATFIYESLPLPLRDVAGRVRYRSDTHFPTFEGVSGRVHRGNFHLQGTLSPVGEDALQIHLLGDVLGRDMTRAMQRSSNIELRDFGRTLADYQLAGNTDTTIEIRGLTDPRVKVELRLSGATATGPALPFALDSITGRLRYDQNYLRIDNVVGWHNAGWFEISGEQRFDEENGFQHVKIAGQNLVVTGLRKLRTGLLKDLGPMLERLRPEGTLKRIELEHDTRDAERYPRALLTLGDLTLRPRTTWIGNEIVPPDTEPIVLSAGTLFYNPKDGFRLLRASATVGELRLREVRAHYRLDAGPPRLRVRAHVENGTFDSPLATYFGPAVTEEIARFEAQGTFEIDALDLEVKMPPGEAPVLRLLDDATLTVDNVSVMTGVPIENITGKAVIERDSFYASTKDMILTGQMAGISMRMFRMTGTELTGRVSVEPEVVGDTTDVFFRVDDVEGRLHDGRLGPYCTFDIGLRKPHRMEGYVAAEGIRVDQLLHDMAEGKDPGDVTGVLSGHFRFRADRAALGTLVGAGAARVVNGRFGSVPAFVTLFNFFNNHFHSLETSHFEVIDRKVYVGSRGHLYADDPIFGYGRPNKPWFTAEGDAMQLDGTGTINFGGELEFQLEPSEIWLSTPIPGLRDFLDLLWQQAGTIYIVGTIERIDVQPILFGIGKPQPGDKQPLRIPDRPIPPAKRW